MDMNAAAQPQASQAEKDPAAAERGDKITMMANKLKSRKKSIETVAATDAISAIQHPGTTSTEP